MDSFSGRRGPLIVGGLALAVTVILLPVSGRPLGPTITFLPAVLAVVACFDLMSMWLLAGEYADTGDRRMLAMAIAYLWSLILMGGYALAFPGVFSVHPPLAVTRSVAPYLYIGWHTGFPVLLGAAWLPGQQLDRLDPRARRPLVVLAAMMVTAVLATLTVIVCVANVRSLPVLIHGLSTAGMTRVTAPVALPLVGCSLVVCVRGLRSRAGPERWATVSVAACAYDLLLTYTSQHRYSLGWYAGRTMTLIAAATVLVAMLGEFRRVKAQAEFNAAYDGLTGLPNRRSTYEALTELMDRARSANQDLTVVMFDLDHFKQINDTHGHAGGDAVLRAVAESMRASVRETDLIGRVGGEEFLLVLVDSDLQAATAVVQRLRGSLRLTSASFLTKAVTASFGVANLLGEDTTADMIIHRADRAMYEAKAAGRDRVLFAAATPNADSELPPVLA